MTSACSDCGRALPHNPRRKGTRCRPCTARAIAISPEHRAACSRAMSRRWGNPNDAAVLSRAISAGISPEERARRAARGRICCNARAAAAGSEARRRAAFSLSQTRMGWCPVEYRDDYRRLRANGGFRAPEARRIIEQQIARDAARYADTRQLQRTTP